MQPPTTSIWLHDPNETASGKPGTLQIIAQLPDIQNPYELFDSMMKRPCGADNLAQACLLSFRTS